MSDPTFLTVVAGPDRGRRVPLDRPLVLGRDPDCDVVLADPDAAPRQLRLSPMPDGVRVEVLAGVVRHGAVALEAGVVAPGGVLTVGRTEIALGRRTEAAPPAGGLVGRSPSMETVRAGIERVAQSDLGVLLQGETGTGKELVARAIHDASPRARRPFVVLDCSSIPRDLVETTLFGHERGAFTGAVARHRGLFEQADGGTLFLDEIGELDPALQPRLLRVLETGEIKRVGGDTLLEVDARIIAATHRELDTMVAEGRFREDLFFRLGGVQLRLPALRDRRDDIPLLVEHFLDELARDGQIRRVATPAVLATLAERNWPGNVRELRNTVVRACSLSDGPALTVADLEFDRRQARTAPIEVPHALPFKVARQEVVQGFELAYLRRLMDRVGPNVSRAAREAGLTRYHLRELLKKHGLHRPA